MICLSIKYRYTATSSGECYWIRNGSKVGVMEHELSLQQQLEMSLRASQCPPQIVPQWDTDRQLQAAIKTEMALSATTGNRDRFLQLALDSLTTISPTSVEAERAFSAAGILCSKLRSSLGDHMIDTLCYCHHTIVKISSSVITASCCRPNYDRQM